MIYLATPSSPEIQAAMRTGELGQLVTPNSGNVVQSGATWALDNGCFGGKWTGERWMAAMERDVQVPRCLFAVVPDVVGDSDATDQLWAEHADTVRSYGYRAAYVTQNGCQAIPDDAEAVFTGGDNAWKLGPEAQALVAQAKTRGLWAHMGRVNSYSRLAFAKFHGYDSVDGTFLAFAPDTNLTRLRRWMRRLATYHPPPW